MFYPVRIFSNKGKLKKEISSDSLSKRYWKDFNESVRTNIQINAAKVKQLKKADYIPQYDESYFSED
jgi:hypothetical protein